MRDEEYDGSYESNLSVIKLDMIQLISKIKNLRL